MVVENSENAKKASGRKSLLAKSLVVGAVGTVSMMASSKIIGGYNQSNEIVVNNQEIMPNQNPIMPNIKAPKIDVGTNEVTMPLSEFLGQNRHTMDQRHLEIEGDADIIWLFAFPESGANHMIHILQTVSQRGMASNNGKMYIHPNGLVTPAPMSRNNMLLYGERGPPLLSGQDLAPPTAKAMVHTTVHGACFNCHPKEYMHNMEAFRNDLWMASTIKDGKIHKVPYDTNFVKSGLHLYRYPFDNIVRRYWAHRQQKRVENANGWLAKYDASADGFQKWCAVQDSHWNVVEKAWYGPETYAMTANVPCHQEFVKYINYYNNVEMIERGAGLNMTRICYEEFYNHYYDTVGNLLKLMDLPVVRDTPPGGGNDIRMGFSQHYFSIEQKDATYKFLKHLAYPGVKEMMEMFERNDFSYK